MPFCFQLCNGFVRGMFTGGGRHQLAGLGRRGLNQQGIVAGHRNAPDEVQELLEVELPITVQIQFLHHPVHNTWVLLVLCEGSQLGVHEGQKLPLGESAVVPFTPCVPLEHGEQGLDAALGLCGLLEQEASSVGC